jgi:hypothetical protein
LPVELSPQSSTANVISKFGALWRGNMLIQIKPTKGGDPSLFVDQESTDPKQTRTQAIQQH